MSAKNPPGRGVFPGGWDGEAVAQIPREVKFADPPEEDAEGPQARYSTRRPQGPPPRNHPSGISYAAVSAILQCTKTHDVVSRFAGPSPSAFYRKIMYLGKSSFYREPLSFLK